MAVLVSSPLFARGLKEMLIPKVLSQMGQEEASEDVEPVP